VVSAVCGPSAFAETGLASLAGATAVDQARAESGQCRQADQQDGDGQGQRHRGGFADTDGGERDGGRHPFFGHAALKGEAYLPGAVGYPRRSDPYAECPPEPPAPIPVEPAPTNLIWNPTLTIELPPTATATTYTGTVTHLVA
jgi:hypothetical protein